MATDKRERQRLNRAAKQVEESKVARKTKIIDTARRLGKWIVLGVLLIVLANIVWG